MASKVPRHLHSSSTFLTQIASDTSKRLRPFFSTPSSDQTDSLGRCPNRTRSVRTRRTGLLPRCFQAAWWTNTRHRLRTSGEHSALLRKSWETAPCKAVVSRSPMMALLGLKDATNGAKGIAMNGTRTLRSGLLAVLLGVSSY